VSAFGILCHPQGFYRIERVHSLPPEAKPHDYREEDDDREGTRRGKKDRWIDDDDDDDDGAAEQQNEDENLDATPVFAE